MLAVASCSRKPAFDRCDYRFWQDTLAGRHGPFFVLPEKVVGLALLVASYGYLAFLPRHNNSRLITKNRNTSDG
jgi:hypothetical protein